jgi:hypothetical protein
VFYAVVVADTSFRAVFLNSLGHFPTQIAAAGIAKRQTIVAASAPITISLLTHIAITSRDRPS